MPSSVTVLFTVGLIAFLPSHTLPLKDPLPILPLERLSLHEEPPLPPLVKIQPKPIAPVSKSIAGPPQELPTKSPEISADKISRFIWKHFSVETDRRQFGKNDYWQSPRELLLSKKGDCEDFAVFAQKLLKGSGKTSLILSVYGSGYAHTVTLMKEDGKFIMIDGAKVRRYPVKSLRKAIERMYPFWKSASIVSFSERSRLPIVMKVIQR